MIMRPGFTSLMQVAALPALVAATVAVGTANLDGNLSVAINELNGTDNRLEALQRETFGSAGVGDWGGKSCNSDSGAHDCAPLLQHWADQPQDQHLSDCGMK